MWEYSDSGDFNEPPLDDPPRLDYILIRHGISGSERLISLVKQIDQYINYHQQRGKQRGLDASEREELLRLLRVLDDFTDAPRLYPNRAHNGRSMASLVFRDEELKGLLIKWCNRLEVEDAAE